MATEVKDKGKEGSSSHHKSIDEAEKALKMELSSESLPMDWDKGPVIKLVGKNFREIAFDTRKDVFVDFYAEWCGFCRILEPIWNKLGEHFRSSSDVVIAKIDGTINDLPDIDLNTFPSLRLFRKGDNKIFEFTKQNRSLNKLIAFVENGGQLSPSPHESDEDDIEKDKNSESLELDTKESHEISKEIVETDVKPRQETATIEEVPNKTPRRGKPKKTSIKKKEVQPKK